MERSHNPFLSHSDVLVYDYRWYHAFWRSQISWSSFNIGHSGQYLSEVHLKIRNKVWYFASVSKTLFHRLLSVIWSEEKLTKYLKYELATHPPTHFMEKWCEIVPSLHSSKFWNSWDLVKARSSKMHHIRCITDTFYSDLCGWIRQTTIRFVFNMWNTLPNTTVKMLLLFLTAIHPLNKRWGAF